MPSAFSSSTINDLPDGDGWVLLAPYGDAENFAALENAAEFRKTFPDLQVDDRGQVRVIQRFNRAAANRLVEAASKTGTVWGKTKKFLSGLRIFRGHPDSPANGDRYADKGEKGLVVKVEARDTGLFGLPVFSPAGADLLNTEPGLALSVRFRGAIADLENGMPVYEPVELLSVGLTPRPNLRSEVLNDADRDAQTQTQKPETQMDKTKLIGALAPLGVTLANDAGDDAILTAITGLKPRIDAGANLATLTNERDAEKARATKLEAELTNERTAHRNAIISAALTAGRITEAERGLWERRLTADFTNEAPVLAALPPKVKTESLPKPGTGAEAENQAPAPLTRAEFDRLNPVKQAEHCRKGGQITD